MKPRISHRALFAAGHPDPGVGTGYSSAGTGPILRVDMIWFFEREQDRLHYEIRHQTDGLGYELVITYPDGRQETERYSETGALLDRSSRLEDTLVSSGWQPPRIRGRAGQTTTHDPRFAIHNSQLTTHN